jgi:hypothetical protein
MMMNKSIYIALLIGCFSVVTYGKSSPSIKPSAKKKAIAKNANYYRTALTGAHTALFSVKNVFKEKIKPQDIRAWDQATQSTRQFLLQQNFPQKVKDAVLKLDDLNNTLTNAVKIITRSGNKQAIMSESLKQLKKAQKESERTSTVIEEYIKKSSQGFKSWFSGKEQRKEKENIKTLLQTFALTIDLTIKATIRSLEDMKS